jgi:hypothetical protein
MLRFDTLPPTFAALLAILRPCFTAPSFRTFTALAAGMIAMPQRRTVTGMLTGAGLAGIWHHSKAHWFFSHARWSLEQIGACLTVLIATRILAADEAIVIAVDDTLFRRAGRKVHAAAWHHDGAAKGPRTNKIAWGNNWVIAAIVVRLPFCDRPTALPVGRQIHVVADAHYAGADGAPGATHGANRHRGLPAGITLTSRLRANAKLNAIAVPTPGKGGRPKRIGDLLGTPKDLATTTAWTATTVTRYARVDTVHIADTRCLWYGAYRSREVRVILVRDPASKAKAGYDLALITTDLTSPAADIIARYADRWSIEVAIADAKQITGVGQARNRTPTAVARTVPFGLTVQTLTVCWYTLHGHHPDTITQRRTQAPWYRTKTQPAYHDMITTLRRTLIAARFLRGKPRNPTPEETHTIHLAWAEAAA